MADVFGVHLLPATGEFTYDTVAYLGQRATEPALTAINAYAGQSPTTDYSVSINQLQAQHPECQTVSVVCAWFFDGTTAGSCHVYPSTTYIGGSFQKAAGGADHWRCSGLTEASSGLIALPAAANGTFIYGGTPSDQSIVRCIQDLKARGLRVVFYPFLLGTSSGEPWRGQITYSPDLSAAATSAVNAFLGSAAVGQFTRDTTNLTVSYSGSSTDWTYRRMILHYANLCVIAGGVDLFVIGSELRGMEPIRGPAWTKAGTTDGSGNAVWDYPFVAGLVTLAADVRSVFDGAGLTKNTTTWKNLLTYSPDWSSYSGWQHPGANGQWPHLDSLFASTSIDLVSFDNYLPLSDWTTGTGGLDAANWQAPPPSSWPTSTPNARGFGLTGAPSVYSSPYLQANIEGGEGFDWFYDDSNNLGAGLDPNGSGQYVSLPEGDRLAQSRNAYSAGQQLLGRKQYRWWMNNTHRAVYDVGSGWAPQGPHTPWAANSKPLVFLEYGFATVDKCTNQPNLFFSPSSVQSGTPFWSAWDSADGARLLPRRDDLLADTADQAVYDYWSNGANNPTVGGHPLVLTAFCCAWSWDARPFPTFPANAAAWGDAGNWGTGNWIAGKGPILPAPAPPTPPGPGSYALFPTPIGEGWNVKYSPRFSTGKSDHVSGRQTRAGRYATPLWDIELTVDFLRQGALAEFETIVAFFAQHAGRALPFLFAPPGNLGVFTGVPLGTGDSATTAFRVSRTLGGYPELVQAFAGAPVVRANGVVVPAANYAVTVLPGTITFVAAPAAGVALTVDFSAAHVACFVDDAMDFGEFMSMFWEVKTLRIETVRA